MLWAAICREHHTRAVARDDVGDWSKARNTNHNRCEMCWMMVYATVEETIPDSTLLYPIHKHMK